MVDGPLHADRLAAGPPTSWRAFIEYNRFLLAFGALSIVMGTSVGMAQVTTSLYALELGSSETMLGFIAAAQSIGVIFMSLPVGVLTDRLGPRPPFLFGTAAAGLIYASIPLARSPVYLLACTALISCCMPFRFVALNTIFLQQLAALGEAKAGWYRGTHMVGMFLIGPLLGARLVGTLGFAGSYFIVVIALGAARMSEQEASSLISAKGFSYIVALFVLGGVLKRLGGARACAVSFAAIAAASATLAAAHAPILLWIGALIAGLGLGSVQIATLTRYAQVGARTGYGKVSGLNALVGPAGGVTGGLSVGHWFGLQNVFWLAAVGFGIAGLRLASQWLSRNIRCPGA
jgi:predicted MFS family arabinose efflux permease